MRKRPTYDLCHTKGRPLKTLIIGGGLCGLALARLLDRSGADVQLVEAEGRFGGRILAGHHRGAAFDLGPAWFWPGQPRIADLIDQLGLTSFEQFATGDLMFEDATGQVHRGQGFASMEGSLRLQGGLTALVTALVNSLPQGCARLNAPVRSLDLLSDGIRATGVDGASFTADRVVLAVPPRLARTLTLSPALPVAAQAELGNIPTWMAGQAKVVAVYPTPFWREAGLSGDAMSRHGPLVEIHDASPAQGGPFALFGFVGVPPEARRDDTALRQSVVTQLTRLFGPKAANPEALFVKDWARAPHTAVAADLTPVHAHPTYGLPATLRDLWGGRLIVSGTETAPHFGGFLEGALEAAEAAAQTLARMDTPA